MRAGHRPAEAAATVLLALLATLVLAGSTLTGTTAARAETSSDRGATSSDAVVASAPAVRRVVGAGPARGVSSLVAAQLREQRSAQLATRFQTMLTWQAPEPVTETADPRVDAPTCALLGRSWTTAGCSRVTCAAGQEYAKTGANAEVCRIGGRYGASYGTEVDFRRCEALNRTWIGLLNYCASDPHRDEVVVADAPQCSAPYTSYVLMSETEGAYDECFRPRRVAEMQAVAAETGRTLAAVAAEGSTTQCGWRAGYAWVDGACRAGAARPAVRDNVAVVGDSITWRGTDELATLQPDWVIDGVSGRQVDALSERLGAFRAAWGEPGGVIFALGTNGRSGWTEEQFRASIATLPADVPVLFVTPFREPGSVGRPALMDAYSGWMQRLVAERPRTCLADWRAAVSTDNELLVDGVHPTSVGEVFWAELVDSSWSECVARSGLISS